MLDGPIFDISKIKITLSLYDIVMFLNYDIGIIAIKYSLINNGGKSK